MIPGVDWRVYCAMRELLDTPGLRMTYLQGALELMSPSPRHGALKTRIARLFETFALERDVPLYGYGSTTFKREAKEAGLEPDECYVLGGELAEIPDIAIEVVLTSGGLPKLPVYHRFGIREVWFWIEDSFDLYRLQGGAYQGITRSEAIPGLDFDLLATFVRRPDQPQAAREYRDLVRSGR